MCTVLWYTYYLPLPLPLPPLLDSATYTPLYYGYAIYGLLLCYDIPSLCNLYAKLSHHLNTNPITAITAITPVTYSTPITIPTPPQPIKPLIHTLNTLQPTQPTHIQ